MLRLTDALERVLAGAIPLPAERVPLAGAVGRVLAEDVRAALALPAWDNASMDGYAARAADVRGARPDAPVRLRVLETIAAGRAPRHVVATGEASRIMTGAPLPRGADCVVRVEDTDGGTETVEVRDDRDAGRNVRPAGEDVRAGDVALPAGTLLGGAQLALVAALGLAGVAVRRRPRVAILSSGDELVPPGDAPAGEAPAGDACVVATNGLALGALAAADGADVVDLGIAPDDPGAIAERARGAAGCDLLVTTGGASVGAFDYTQRALERLGLALDFWRVRVRPGAQTAFGRLGALDGLPWLGLPGNPVSAQVTYELFVRPRLRRLLGHARPHRQPVTVVLDEPVRAPAAFTHLLRARVRVENGMLHARLTGPQGSGLLSSTARADALLVVPDGAGELAAGSTAAALLLRDDALHGDAAPRTASW